MSFDDNPWHAYKHLEASLYLSLDDRTAVETLFNWGRRNNKALKATQKTMKLIRRHEERKTQRIAQLEEQLKEMQ